jgi:starvation-inducible outer membrane lipoprotein
MKIIKPLLTGSIALLAAGCATTPEPESPDAEQARWSQSNLDYEYIHLVNKLARDHGTHVIWVNLPRKDRRHDDGE